MKRFLMLLSFCSVFSAFSAMAQEEGGGATDCDLKLSLYFESIKAGNYKDAYPNWLYSYQNCPKSHPDMYLHGAEILRNLIPEATGEEQQKLKNLILEVYAKRLELYPDEKVGYVYSLLVSDMNKLQLADSKKIIETIQEALEKDRLNIDAVVLNLYFVHASKL